MQCHTIIADTVQNNNTHTFFNFYLLSAPHKFSCLLTGKPTSVFPTTTTTNVRGVAECVGRLYYEAKEFVRVWRHEITRVIFDRLISEEDHVLVKGHLVRLLSANYEKNMDYVMRDPILYGDYINTLEPAEPRLYECIQDFPTAQVWYVHFTDLTLWRPCPSSVSLFVHGVEVWWSHRLEYFENNIMAD